MNIGQPNHWLWLRHAAVATCTLVVSVFIVGLVISRNPMSAMAAALLGASVGGAMGTLQYRHQLSITSTSWRCLRLWLLSVIWGAPLLAAALLLDQATTAAPQSFWFNVSAAVALSAAMSLVSWVPLHWLQGRWGQRHAP